MSNDAAIKAVDEATSQEFGKAKVTYTLDQSRDSSFSAYLEVKRAAKMETLLRGVEISENRFYRIKVKDKAGRLLLVPVKLQPVETAAPEEEAKPKPEAELKPKAEPKPKVDSSGSDKTATDN